MSTLTVMCGIPGSGKSTWVAANADDATVLSIDIVRKRRGRVGMHQLTGIKMIAPDHLRRGENVIIDACSTSPDDRHEWLFLARRANADTRLVVVDTPATTCIKRQAERGRSRVPDLVIERQAARFKRSLPLLKDEGWGEIIYTRGDA